MAIDFRLRDFFFPVRIHKLRRTMEKTQWLPADELKAFQESLLSKTIDQAFAHVPYYREISKKLGLARGDIRTVEDLEKLPLLSKDDVRDAGERMLSDNASRHHPGRYHTSGTTGAPITLYHGRNSNALEFAFYWRHWSWAGYRLRDPFAELHTSRFLLHEELSLRLSLWQPHLRRLLLNSVKIGPAQAAALAGEIRKHRCLFLKGLASTLYCFALACREAGLEDLHFHAVFSTGENLRPHFRRLLESVFHGPILDTYGHMERTAAVTQCPRGGYHVNADYGVLAVENLKPSSDGQTLIGRAVGTSLHNPVMPLLRYDIGDDIEVYAKPRACPCGRTLPLIKAIHGRNGEAVVTPDGRFLTSLYVLPDLMEGIRFIQFIQESPAGLSVLVVPDPTWNEKVRDMVFLYIRRAVGTDMTVSLREVGPDDLVRDPSGKIRCVVSLANLSSEEVP